MTVIVANGARYAVTPQDRLWLLRAVQAEGPIQLDVARALVNLFALRRSRDAELTLEKAVRQYAQPVNPQWYPDGLAFRRSLIGKTPQAVKEALAKAERRRAFHSTREVFDQAVHDAVRVALEQPWHSDVTDYAAPWVDASRKYAPRSPSVKGRNRLWSREPGWAGYTVEKAGVPVVLLAIIGAAVAARVVLHA